MFCELNGIRHDGAEQWLICPGMDFNTMIKWWGDRSERTVPHEGLDLGFFKNADGKVIHLSDQFRIPCLFDGEVVACFRDYLGKTLVFSHGQHRDHGTILCSIYGHVDPLPHLRKRKLVGAGESVAVVATVNRRDIASHLHISLGWAYEKTLDQLDSWKTITNPSAIRLFDPAGIVGPVFTVPHTELFSF